MSIQAQVVNLFADLRGQLGLAILFISHDLHMVRHFSDRLVVMYLGRSWRRVRQTRSFTGLLTPTRVP